MASHGLTFSPDTTARMKELVTTAIRACVGKHLWELELQRNEALWHVGHHPDPVRYSRDCLQDCVRQSEQLLEQSETVLQSIVVDTVQNLRLEVYSRSTPFEREHLMVGISGAALVRRPPPTIDMTESRNNCRSCYRELEGLQPRVFSVCGCVRCC